MYPYLNKNQAEKPPPRSEKPDFGGACNLGKFIFLSINGIKRHNSKYPYHRMLRRNAI
jgi:hypothetical protein